MWIGDGQSAVGALLLLKDGRYLCLCAHIGEARTALQAGNGQSASGCSTERQNSRYWYLPLFLAGHFGGMLMLRSLFFQRLDLTDKTNEIVRYCKSEPKNLVPFCAKKKAI